MRGATLFPSNMAVAATGNTDLSYQQGEVTAKEANAIGVHITLAPVMDVNNNPGNPIINFRSYSDDPNMVIDYGNAFIKASIVKMEIIQDKNSRSGLIGTILVHLLLLLMFLSFGMTYQDPPEPNEGSMMINFGTSDEGSGEVEAEEVGQFQLADFPNSRGLQPIGQSMLVETPASGAAVIANPYANGFGSLVQGALESSNVNVVQELVDMIETQRAYEVNSKAISGVDDMLRFISQNL